MIKKYDRYKDSGVEWLKEIPKEWPVAKFKRFAKIRNGKDQKAVLTENGEYPVLGTGGEFGRANEFLYDQPSLLLGRKGTIDKPQFIEVPFWTVDTLFYTEVLEDNSPKYLYYFSQIFPFSLLQESSAVPSMTQGKLHNLELCKPSREEQTKIAEYLDHQTGLIDAIIEKKQQLIEKLKEQRQAIINEAVTKGLDPNVPMKDSGVEWLGEIPEHWKVAKLKFLTEKIIDGAHFTPTYVDEGIPFLRVTDIQTHEINLSKVKFIPKEEHDELIKRCRPEKGDVLLSKNGTIGITKVINWDWEFSIFVSLCLIKFKEELSPFYFSHFFNSSIVDQQIKIGSKTTSVTNLHLDKIKELLIAIPPTKKEQDRVCEYLDVKLEEIDSIISKAEASNKSLLSYRQSIISEAVTGKIDVREWEPKTAETV